MLAAAYASSCPPGLGKLVLAGAPASIPLYEKGCRDLLAQLPNDVRETIEECERKGDFESPEYEKASGVFYARHVCRLDPSPESIVTAFQHLQEDPTAYLTM